MRSGLAKIATEEETMTVDFIDRARENGPFASPGGDERALVRLLTIQEARYAREQEEAAIEDEDFWEQAEEACSVDPIG